MAASRRCIRPCMAACSPSATMKSTRRPWPRTASSISISPSSILYPFEEVRSKGGDYPTTVENIDIGGPAMIRASAKNHAYVTVITNPADYEGLIGELKANAGSTSYGFRQKMAAAAYARTAAYDAAISNWFADELNLGMMRIGPLAAF